LATDIPDLPVRVAVLATTYCLSAFFSGSETALFSFQPDELKRMDAGSGPDRVIAALRSRPRRLLIAILFGNMVVNVVFFSTSFLMFAAMEERLSGAGVVLLSLASLLAVLVGGEVMPKSLAVTFYHQVGRVVAYPILVIQKLLLPVVLPLEKVADAATRLVGHRGPAVQPDELRMLVSLGAREGIVDAGAGQMLAEVLSLREIRVNELMVPRIEMVAFNLQDPAEELLPLFRREKLTMIPVHDGHVDEMRGVIHIKDVLFRPEDQELAELVRPIPFLPETTPVEDALRRCRWERKKSAFVVDEYGAVLGLITMEDLLEEVVGEIADEYDVEESPPVEWLADGRVRVDGTLGLRDWQEAVGLDLPDLGVDTVGGVVMALLDRVPEKGDRVSCGGMELEVESAADRRAVAIVVTLPEQRGREDA
jgi:CBS domain containing-hemolysin-like protein